MANTGHDEVRVASRPRCRPSCRALSTRPDVLAASHSLGERDEADLELTALVRGTSINEIHGMPAPIPDVAVLPVEPAVLGIVAYPDLEHHHGLKGREPPGQTAKAHKSSTASNDAAGDAGVPLKDGTDAKNSRTISPCRGTASAGPGKADAKSPTETRRPDDDDEPPPANG